MDEQKEILIDNVKEWISIDEEIKQLQKLSREKRKRKKEITDALLVIMKQNEIEYVDIGKNDTLEYSKNITKKGLSKKHLIDSIKNFYKNDESLANSLVTHILDSRSETTKETIKRNKIKSKK